MKSKLIRTLIMIWLSGTATAFSATTTPPLLTSASLTLDRALALAQENNPRARQAEEEARAAEARVTKEQSAFYPQISAKAGYLYRDPVSEMAISGGVPMKFMPNSSYDAHVTAQMTLLDFGKRSAGVDVALSSKAAAGYRRELTARDISFSTIRTFYTLLYLDEAVSVQDKEIAALKKNLDFTAKRYREGAATRFDMLTTEVRLAAAANRKIDLENERRNQEITFRRLTGLKSDIPLNLQGSFDITPSLSDVSKLTGEALHNRMELKLARENELAANARQSLAGRLYFPTITGSLSYGTMNGYVPDIDRMRENIAAGVELHLPIFNGFKTGAENREATAMKLAAMQEKIDAEEQVRAEVGQSLNALDTSREKTETTRLQADRARLAAEQARIRYRNGLATSLDLLDSEAALAQAELAHLQARYEYTLNAYTVRRAAGDLFR